MRAHSWEDIEGTVLELQIYWYEVKARTPVKLFGMSLKLTKAPDDLESSDFSMRNFRTITGSRSSLRGRERVEELGGPIGVVCSLVALTSVKRY